MKFRMIDQIVSWHPYRDIRGVKAVSFEEYAARAALGQGDRCPESILLQSAIELASWLIILSSDFADMGLPTAIGEAQFLAPLRPGQRVILEATMSRDGFAVIGESAGRRVIELEALELARVPLADYHDPDDLRVLFSEFHRPLAGATA